MNRQWARELTRFSSKVYGLKQMVKRANDERQHPTIKSATIFVVMLFFFLYRGRSMEELDRQVHKGRYRHLIPKNERQPSHDTARNALMQWDLESHEDSQDQFVSKFKQNKGPQKGSIDGWRVAAIDGVELFASTSRCCEECLTRHPTNGDIEYFHRAVFMQKVGGDPRIIYGFELLTPRDGANKDEGETTGAKRLIQNVAARHGRVADVLTLDALYAKAPIIHEVLDHSLDAVIRMKEERRLIMQDAKGLFDGRDADTEWDERDSNGHPVHVQAWDEGELTSWEQVRIPMRMIKIVRTIDKTAITGGEKQTQVEVLERWVATTFKQTAVPTVTVAKIAAARWDIENQGFHDLKTYWHMDHALVHHPRAIEALLGFLILAVNFLYTFLFGHLHHFRNGGIPVCEVVEEIKEQIRWLPYPLLYLFWDTR